MAVRYFFINDKIMKNEVSIGNMTAGMFTKPLQGRLFKKFRDR